MLRPSELLPQSRPVSWDPGTESGIEDPGRHERFSGPILSLALALIRGVRDGLVQEIVGCLSNHLEPNPSLLWR